MSEKRLSKKRFCITWIIASIIPLALFSFALYDSNNPGCSSLAVFGVWLFGFPASMAIMGIVLVVKYVRSKLVENRLEEK